ncbi:MAG TPA: DUF3667 domain-containing protein [Phenylobacterium sp.]
MDVGEQLLETAVDDTVAAEVARAAHHSLPVGTPCPNCATALQGAWCHACGQRAEKYDRSIWHLTVEAFEGLTHFDGRFWTTLGRLVARPGQLTRDYLDGHRAPEIPPFRMFLVVLLAVFFSGQLNFSASHIKFRFEPADIFIARDPADRAAFKEAADAVRAKPSMRWLIEGGEHAVKDPEALLTAMEHWSHQFAVLLLPIAALNLAVLFAFRRGVYVFDHLIFSMHSLSFQGLLLSATFLLAMATPWAWLLLLIAPVHLFVHMRGAYRIGTASTLLRMALLFVGSAAGFGVLMMSLFFVGLATLH